MDRARHGAHLERTRVVSGPVAIDCHGFGGGFTLGAAQAGWDLAAKFSREAGFGVLNTLANYELLGHDWDSIARDPSEWEPLKADMVFGNPPCAAFSLFNRAMNETHGMDSPINAYMWELVRYAGLVAPPIVIFESVQQAFNKGLPLMRQLRDELEEISGHKYTLLHVLHNNVSVGGVSVRKRYFWVASRVPFGVESSVVARDGSGAFPLTYVPTFGDMLRDLEPLGLTMHKQRYVGAYCDCEDHGGRFGRLAHNPRHTFTIPYSSDWCRREMHDGTGFVDGHNIEYKPILPRMLSLLYDERDNLDGVVWEMGTELSDVMRAYVAKNGCLPEEWRYMSWISVRDENDQLVYQVDERGKRTRVRRMVRRDEHLISSGYQLGVHQTKRWWDSQPTRVIAGDATNAIFHPHLNRTLTHRECARIQGFPDEWKIYPIRNTADLGPSWGKGVPVQAGRWIAYWAKQSLDNKPGELTGQPIPEKHKAYKKYGPAERELMVDITDDWQRVFAD